MISPAVRPASLSAHSGCSCASVCDSITCGPGDAETSGDPSRAWRGSRATRDAGTTASSGGSSVSRAFSASFSVGGGGFGGGGGSGGALPALTDALGQCALRYVWFWATKRKKLTSALSQVGVRVLVCGIVSAGVV